MEMIIILFIDQNKYKASNCNDVEQKAAMNWSPAQFDKISEYDENYKMLIT